MHKVVKVTKTFLAVLAVVSGIFIIENLFMLSLGKLWDFFVDKLGHDAGPIVLGVILTLVLSIFGTIGVLAQDKADKHMEEEIEEDNANDSDN